MKRSSSLALLLVCLVTVGLVGTADSQTWTSLTNTPTVSLGAMVLLTDGRVLLHAESNCGGSTCKGKDYTAWWTLTPDANGSYVNGTFTQVASLPGGYAPLFFSSAVLPDGKVAIQGGEYQCTAGSCVATWQSLGAIFDPVANAWTAIAPPIPNALEAMGDSESVVLSNGTWMIGICCAQFVGYTPYPDYVYFNESNLTYTPMGYVGDGQTTEYDEAGFNLLPNGKVLMVNVPLGAYDPNLATSQVYDPVNNVWAAPVSTQVQLWDADCGNSASASYELGPVMLLPNGKLWGTGASSCQAGHTALYDPVAGTWTAMADFPNKGAANDAAGATEINGNAIIATSPFTNETSTPITVYEFNATTQTITAVANPVNASKDDSFVAHMLVLPTGQILYTDYLTNGVQVWNSAGTYDPSWQPTISSAPTNLTIGTTYSISGTQFNGVTTGAAYGDDFQDNTNYPLVRIVTTNNNHTYYARTHDHSTMGVQTGSLPVSTNFDVPVIAAADLGPCQLFVVANGIPSAASPCNVAQPAGIYSPVNGTPLTSTSVTFLWGGDPNATAYWLDVGSTQGSHDYYQSGSLSTATLSQSVTGLPSNGSTVYATWYELVGGTWQPTGYSYTALGNSGSIGQLASPFPGATLTSAAPTVIWSAGTGSTAYWLNVGSTPGGNQYFNSGNLGNVLTVATKGLPTNGSTVYMTLYSLVGGTWYPSSATYTAFTPPSSGAATMTTPVPPGPLAGSSQAFAWSTATGAQAYWLDIGTAPGGNNIYTSKSLSRNTHGVTATGLPTNGSTVYATLYTELSGTWLNNAYVYTAANPASSAGVLNSPMAGSTLTASSATFGWTAGASATAYWLDLGKTPGGNQYYQSGNLGNVLTTSANGLPTDGSTIYATLYSLVSGTWVNTTATYTAYNATGGLALMLTPPPGSMLSGSSATFTWSSDTNATGYWVDISAVAPGGNDVYQSGNLGTALSTSVFSLPANGSTIYVTLYSLVGGQWLHTSSTYVSGP